MAQIDWYSKEMLVAYVTGAVALLVALIGFGGKLVGLWGKKGGDKGASTTATSTGPQSPTAAAQGDANLSTRYDSHDTIHHGISAGEFAEIIRKQEERHARERFTLEGKVGELTTQVESLQQKLTERELEAARDGFNRVAAEADQGDKQAREAINEARESGDMTKLREALVAAADRREDEIREGAADYFELCREIAAIAYLTGDIDEASSRLQTILRFKPNDLDAINRLGHIHHLRGELAEAEARYKQVESLAGGDDSWKAIAYGNLGLIHRTRGDLDQAEAMHRKALAIEEKLGRQEGMAIQCGNLGLIYETRGELDQAEAMHRKSLAIEEKLGRQEGMAAAYGNLGSVAVQRGKIDEARKLWTQARDQYAKIGMPRMVKKVQGLLDGSKAGK